MDLKDIKAIIDLMKKNSISEFELEKQDFKIKLKRTHGGQHVAYDEPTLLPAYGAVPANVVQATTAAAPLPSQTQANGDFEIKSPMVGTFYRSPSPEAGNYAEIGTVVNPATVVCIIEAMKVMNEIKAEKSGVITACLLDNARPVEFGQPLFKIRPL